MTPQLIGEKEATNNDADEPSRDEVFKALSKPAAAERDHLPEKQHDDDARVRDIAEQLAAWENDVEIPEVTYKQRKRVYTALHQSHLPKLAGGDSSITSRTAGSSR